MCHVAHGSREEHLLIFGPSNNELCLACHTQIRPGLFEENGDPRHPVTGSLSESQLRAVDRFAGTVSIRASSQVPGDAGALHGAVLPGRLGYSHLLPALLGVRRDLESMDGEIIAPRGSREARPR